VRDWTAAYTGTAERQLPDGPIMCMGADQQLFVVGFSMLS
jgi:hypothetical protein